MKYWDRINYWIKIINTNRNKYKNITIRLKKEIKMGELSNKRIKY
jgi:hypothetical protein